MKAANLCSAIGRVTAHTLNGDTFGWKGFYQDLELLKASVSAHTGIPLLLMNLEVVKREGQHVTVSVSPIDHRTKLHNQTLYYARAGRARV